MRICLILEGCYPYVNGGVSSWMHQYITEMTEHEFVLLTLGAYSKDRGKFKYQLPENVVEIKEMFLDGITDLDEAQSELPKADIYHSIATGYAGLLASLGSYLYQVPLFLTEHGIYTREREEEILRSDWVLSTMKKRWIQFFYMLSNLIYDRAVRVTSLYTKAKFIQEEVGCDLEKCQVISNGIHYDRFANIPLKKEDGWIDIGAVVRIAPIKDIKTMLYVFFELSQRVPKVRLHILGAVGDESYYQECLQLMKQLDIKNVVFTGQVDVISYMEKLDFTILTSISEAQPLSVIESMAARRPCVTTDVGCCRELLEGNKEDKLGRAGYCVPPTYCCL